MHCVYGALVDSIGYAVASETGEVRRSGRPPRRSGTGIRLESKR